VPIVSLVAVAASMALAGGVQTDCSARPPDLPLPSYRIQVVDAEQKPVDWLEARAGIVVVQQKFLWKNFDYGWVDESHVVDVPIRDGDGPGQFITGGKPAVHAPFILELPTFKPCYARFSSFFVAVGRERPPLHAWSLDSRPKDVAVYQVPLGSPPTYDVPSPVTVIEVLYPPR
jgi:hypothetical protein